MQRWPENWCGRRLRRPPASHVESSSPPSPSLCLPAAGHPDHVFSGRFADAPACHRRASEEGAPTLSINAAGGALHSEQGVWCVCVCVRVSNSCCMPARFMAREQPGPRSARREHSGSAPHCKEKGNMQ